MTLQEMINVLNLDLQNEYLHWHTYMNAAIIVSGFHREEYSEFFRAQAASEMEHIEAFGNMIVGLGGTPAFTCQPPTLNSNVSFRSLLKNILELEDQVVANYVQRIDDAIVLQENGGLDKIHGKYIELFLEDQIMDSRKDADHIRQILIGE